MRTLVGTEQKARIKKEAFFIWQSHVVNLQDAYGDFIARDNRELTVIMNPIWSMFGSLGKMWRDVLQWMRLLFPSQAGNA